jgi:hypothetical protein
VKVVKIFILSPHPGLMISGTWFPTTRVVGYSLTHLRRWEPKADSSYAKIILGWADRLCVLRLPSK